VSTRGSAGSTGSSGCSRRIGAVSRDRSCSSLIHPRCSARNAASPGAARAESACLDPRPRWSRRGAVVEGRMSAWWWHPVGRRGDGVGTAEAPWWHGQAVGVLGRGRATCRCLSRSARRARFAALRGPWAGGCHPACQAVAAALLAVALLSCGGRPADRATLASASAPEPPGTAAAAERRFAAEIAAAQEGRRKGSDRVLPLRVAAAGRCDADVPGLGGHRASGAWDEQ
jgi:hypothetical protein